MDFAAFASLAQVRILLMPVGSIQRETFDKWAAEIRTFDNIRLGDIPADSREDRARFMPSPLSKGHLHLSFPSHPPSASHHPLALFRPSSFPLGIIGVAACSQADSLSSLLAEFNAAVNEMFPLNSLYRPIFPLANTCFVFEEGDGNTNLNFGEQLAGLVVIPSMMGNKKLYIGTLLSDLCSNILGAFSLLVQTLETPVGNEYLNATLFPIVPSIMELPVSLDDGPTSRSFAPPLPSHNSQPEIGTLATLRSTTNMQRPSSAGPSSPRGSVRQSTLGTPSASRNLKRQTIIGAASSHGRLFKTLGDFFLLAGRTEDALVWYIEAMALCKSSNDSIWHAAALEGTAVVAVVDSWTQGYGLNSSFSHSRGPWADIAEKLTQVSALYAKAPSTVDVTDGYHPLIAHLYTSSVLRHANLLFATWSAKGWGPLAFTTLLQPGPKPALPPTLSGANALSEGSLERLSMITNISRAQIAAVVAEAHGPWLLHLGVRERITLLENIAGLYACLGYKRKEAYVLREVLGCVMDLVVIGRDDAGERRSISSPSNSTGLGIQNVDVIGSGSVGVRENERTEGNEAILRVVRYVCSVHGIDTDAVKLVNLGSTSPRSGDDYDALAEEVPLEPFGWPELQIGIVREALAVAEALPDYPHVAQFCLSALKVLYPVLTAADQQHLYSTSTRALATAWRRGDKRMVDYWSGQPVTSIAVTPLPFSRLPLEKPITSLSLRTSNPILPRVTDPFLYNPRRAITAQGQMTVVQNENVEVVVTLTNPFVFDLELQSLSLSISGVPFEHKAISAVVPPNSYHPVTIIGKALEPGVLTIRGCIVQAPGGAAREFVLPLSTDEEDEKQLRQRSAIQCEAARHKHGGLESRPWKTSKRFSQASSSAANRGTAKFLECNVVAEQPLLRIRRTSLTHGAVMLYNGETSTIRITLENVSKLPVNFVRLSFDDNTIAPAQQALADGELSVFDTYETEYDLIQKPAFLWYGKESEEILPGEETALTVSCQGKVGCSSGSIQISYSYLHRRQSTLQQPADIFHTRHISYPVLVTVYHMLECHDMDVFDWSSLGRRWNTSSVHDDLYAAKRLLTDVDEPNGWCVFIIDVRNTYGLPFEVVFERTQEGVLTATHECVVAPGSTSRVLLPIRKFLLDEDHTSRPIPTLSDRQFVVDKTGLTGSEVVAQRELFWYREELFKCVKGRWKELGGVRGGELSLRRQRMTLPMLDALRTETVRLQVSVDDDTGAHIDAYAPYRYRLASEHFYFIIIRVLNLSPRPLTLTLDVAMEPADHVIHSGILSDIPVGQLQSGESRELEVPVCFAAGGVFELEAHARLWQDVSEGGKVGHGWLKVDIQ